jgi:hypothetical protein
MERIAMDLEGITESGFKPKGLPTSREDVMAAVENGIIEVSYTEKKTPDLTLGI